MCPVKMLYFLCNNVKSLFASGKRIPDPTKNDIGIQDAPNELQKLKGTVDFKRKKIVLLRPYNFASFRADDQKHLF